VCYKIGQTRTVRQFLRFSVYLNVQGIVVRPSTAG
jgi:hypothetical protein